MKIKKITDESLCEPRKDGVIDTVVIHYSSAINIKPDDPYNVNHIIQIFRDYGVSSHYIISRRGKIYQLIHENKKAWHAGGSIMPEPDNRKGVNEFSIGIELVATDKSGFTKLQYKSLKFLCDDIEKRYIKKMTFVGHDEISGERAVEMGLRKDAKVDPGKLFDWTVLR